MFPGRAQGFPTTSERLFLLEKGLCPTNQIYAWYAQQDITIQCRSLTRQLEYVATKIKVHAPIGRPKCRFQTSHKFQLFDQTNIHYRFTTHHRAAGQQW